MPRPQLRAVPSRPDPDTLLLATAGGDRHAYAALFEQVAPRIGGLVRRVVRDPARADEVTQEVLTEIWRTAKRFDPERGTAMTWMTTIAHRRAVDCVRSTQASRDRDDLVARRAERSFDETSEAVVDGAERVQVTRALDELTDLQREAIELAYYGGHTYREVADLLDTPLGTVKTRIRDGLIRLRDTLGVPR